MNGPLSLATDTHILELYPGSPVSSDKDNKQVINDQQQTYYIVRIRNDPFYGIAEPLTQETDLEFYDKQSKQKWSAKDLPGGYSDSKSSPSTSSSSSSSTSLSSASNTKEKSKSLLDLDKLTNGYELIINGRHLGQLNVDSVEQLEEFIAAWKNSFMLGKEGQVKEEAQRTLISEILGRRRSEYTFKEKIQIYCITWNIAGKGGFKVSPHDLLCYKNDGSSNKAIYCISIQESDPLGPTNISASRTTLKTISDACINVLGKDSYSLIASVQLIGMMLIIIADSRLEPEISAVVPSTVGTGVLGIWGNKGAVALTLSIGSDSVGSGRSGVGFGFVNMHLSAGSSHSAFDRRLWELGEIEKKLALPPFMGKFLNSRKDSLRHHDHGNPANPILFDSGNHDDNDQEVSSSSDEGEDNVGANNAKSETDSITLPPQHDEDIEVTRQDHTPSDSSLKLTTSTNDDAKNSEEGYVFVMGDLNFRLVDIELDKIHKFIENKDYKKLKEYDSLSIEHKNKRVLVGFKEGNIDFAPTYKFEADPEANKVSTYVSQRAPAYTDRIFYTPGKGSLQVEQIDYQSLPQYCFSDHKPVKGIFETCIELIDFDKRANILRCLLKELDAKENAKRGAVKVDPQQIKFQTCALQEYTSNLSIKNIGDSLLKYEILSCPNSVQIFPMSGVVPVGANVYIHLKCFASISVAGAAIQEIIVLRILGSQDCFIMLDIDVKPSCIGTDMDTLSRLPDSQGISEGPPPSLKEPIKKNMLTELWKMIDFLYPRCKSDMFDDYFTLKRLHSDPFSTKAIDEYFLRDPTARGILFTLDTGKDFDIPVLSCLPRDQAIKSVTCILLIFLASLPGSIIPLDMYPLVMEGSLRVDKVLDLLPRVSTNSLILLASFFKQVTLNALSLSQLVEILVPLLIADPNSSPSSNAQNQKRAFLSCLIDRY